MARVQGPLHAEEAAGAFAGCLIYSSYYGRPYVKRWAAPKQRHTPAADAARARFAAAVAAWRALSPAEHARWNRRGARLHLAGYNAFLRAQMHP
jgi:hypothetical protein